MPNETGYSLVEVMIALALTTLLSLGFLSLVQGVQEVDQALHALFEKDENLRLCPLLLSRYLWPAGNQRHRYSWPGLDSLDGVLLVRSDLDGSGGFPDGLAEAPFEDLALRQQGRELQLRSGSGGYQPLLRHILSLSHVRHQEDLLTVEVLARSERTNPVSESRVEMEFFLWNYRATLFPAELP